MGIRTINYKGFEIWSNSYDNEDTIKQLFDTFLDSQKNQSFENIERFYYENGKFYTVHKKHPVHNTTPNLSNRIANFDKDDADDSADIDIDDLVDKALEDGYTFEYADTLPALRYNVKNWIEEYLDDNDIDYKLTKKDIKLINSLVKEFYDDNVDEGYHRRKSYSIQEASKELKGSKKVIEKVETSDDEFPDSFEDIIDFLKADEDEAIIGYEKAIAKVEDEFIKSQLVKIEIEEKAHKAYLEKVLKDPAVEYTEPLEDEDNKEKNESFKRTSARKNTIEEAFKLLRNPKKKINEDTRKFEDKDAEEEYFRHIQELSTDYEDPNAEECDDCDEEDIEESYLPRDIYNLCHVIPLDELDEDEVDYEAIEDLEDQVGCKVLGVLDSNVDELNYYYWCSDGHAYMGVPFATGSNTYRWYSKDVNEIAELINGSDDDYDEEDIEESLKEDAKFVTAATILKKEQNSIFAQPTEEGMRKMVLSILNKNKDKMKPENYNKVVKTMTNCPKKAVPSTVWTMLNPSQKVGK